MAPNPGGVRAPAGRHAAIQRYLNKASGRMETARDMKRYQRPAPAQHSAVNQQHTVAKTQHKVTREVVTSPQVQKSLYELTPAQIAQRAKQIVDNEVASERVPYQSRDATLGRQLAGSLSAGTSSYAGLDQQIAGQQAHQADTAKTYQNAAADLLKSVSTPSGPAPESEQAKKQAAAGQTLLQSIAAGAQAGTNARQEAQANFLTSARTAAAERGVGYRENVEGAYRTKKEENAADEEKLLSSSRGRRSKLGLEMEEEAEKTRLARQGLGLKTAAEERQEFTATQNAKNQGAQRAGERTKIGQGNRKLRIEEGKAQADAKYKAQRIKQIAEKNSAGKPVSPALLDKHSKDLGGAYQTFEKMRTGKLHDWGEIRQHLASGSEYQEYETERQYETQGKSGKKVGRSVQVGTRKVPVPKVQDATIIRAAEEAWRYHALSRQTLAGLAGKGITFNSQKEAYEAITGRGYTPPKKYVPPPVRGGVNAGGKKK